MLIIILKNKGLNADKKKLAKRWSIRRNRFSNLALLKEPKTNELSDYRNYLRMDDSVFYCLLNGILPGIEKRNIVMRDAVSPEETLIVRFLGVMKT